MKHNKQPAVAPTTMGGVVTGAVVGMMVGASAVVLSKKENRRKLQKHINTVFEMGEDKLDASKEKLNQVKENARQTVAEKLSDVSDSLDEAKKNTQKSRR